MRPRLLELARKDGLPSKVYRVYLHIKRFVFGGLGLKTATWHSKDKKIISCDVVSQETWDVFVAPDTACTRQGRVVVDDEVSE